MTQMICLQCSPITLHSTATQYSPQLSPLRAPSLVTSPESVYSLHSSSSPVAPLPTEDRADPPELNTTASSLAASEMEYIQISLTPATRVLGLTPYREPFLLTVHPSDTVWSILQLVGGMTGIQYPMRLYDYALGQYWDLLPESPLAHQINFTGSRSFIYDLDTGQ